MRSNPNLKWIEFHDNVDIENFMKLSDKVRYTYSITRMNIW